MKNVCSSHIADSYSESALECTGCHRSCWLSHKTHGLNSCFGRMFPKDLFDRHEFLYRLTLTLTQIDRCVLSATEDTGDVRVGVEPTGDRSG